MPKRSIQYPGRKSEREQRIDSQRHYSTYIKRAQKEPSRINPIFLEKPHYGLESEKK